MKSIASVFPKRNRQMEPLEPEDKTRGLMQAVTLGRLILPHIVALLLGRLLLADELSPFGPAFYSVYRHAGGFLSPLSGILVILGSATLGKTSILIYNAISVGLLTFIMKPSREKTGYRFLDALVPGVVIFSVRVVLILFSRQTLLLYISAFLEAVIGVIGAFVFQSLLPYGNQGGKARPFPLETREYLWLFVAVLMMGSLNGIGVFGVTLDMFFAMGGSLVMGYAGGAGYGALFGLLSGAIIALTGSENPVIIGYLGASGALAGIGGLFGKVEAIVGFLSIGLIMSFLEGSGAIISRRLLTQLLSCLPLLLLAGKVEESLFKVFRKGAKSVSVFGEDKTRKDAEKTLKGRIASLSSALSEVSVLFTETSAAKSPLEARDDFEENLEESYGDAKAHADESYKTLIKEITDRVCRDCDSKRFCWEEQFGITYAAFANLTRKTQLTGRIKPQDLIELFDKCSRAGEIAAEINHKKEIDGLQRKLGLLHRETKECLFQQYRCLSHMLDRTLTTKDLSDNAVSDVTSKAEALEKASRFKVSVKGKTIVAGGQEKPGDMWVRYDLAPGKILIALADGMGKGQEAARQSQETIGILKLLLDAGLDYDTCISFLNSGLYLAWRPERFLALDFLLLDMNLERAFFHKMGAPPSFIRRKDGNVVVVRGTTPPVGATKSLMSLNSSEPILPGDLLIMVSDGVFRSSPVPSRAEHMLVMRLSRLKDESPDNCIKAVISQSIRYPGQKPPDDVTVVVVAIA